MKFFTLWVLEKTNFTLFIFSIFKAILTNQPTKANYQPTAYQPPTYRPPTKRTSLEEFSRLSVIGMQGTSYYKYQYQDVFRQSGDDKSDSDLPCISADSSSSHVSRPPSGLYPVLWTRSFRLIRDREIWIKSWRRLRPGLVCVLVRKKDGIVRIQS